MRFRTFERVLPLKLEAVLDELVEKRVIKDVFFPQAVESTKDSILAIL
jgi:hypothetical protein